MSTPKKPATKSVKPSEPRAKYSIGQKVFIIDRYRTKCGEVLEARVQSVQTIKKDGRLEGSPSGQKPPASFTSFEYDLRTANGVYYGLDEWGVHPSLTAVSLAFAQYFTTLLK